MPDETMVGSAAFDRAADVMDAEIRKHGLKWAADRITPHQLSALELLVATYKASGYPIYQKSKVGIPE